MPTEEKEPLARLFLTLTDKTPVLLGSNPENTAARRSSRRFSSTIVRAALAAVGVAVGSYFMAAGTRQSVIAFMVFVSKSALYNFALFAGAWLVDV